VKVSISLPASDVEFLDEYAQRQGIDSRSAVLHKAVRLLQSSALSSAYEQAWDEWATTGEADLWETSAGDGLSS
jgi:Arc/MetJ-type ribon-helix-helix transcriptional regulator